MYKNISIQLYPDAIMQNKKLAEALLQATDWTQLEDSGLTSECKSAFQTYRDSVRQIRKNPTEDAIFPTAPTEEWV